MACTRQSALEYIQNGRRLLVERLQNLSLVVENLFQRKVLQEEEVSKIQAEVDRFDQTRKILDWVTAKGEAACYELLMILDITRKRTLDNADLQQWISCFPFKEDPEMTDYLVGSKPCHRYQSQLKCKARKITEGAWKQSSRLLPERNRNEVTFSYTPLVLDTDVPSSLSKIETKSKRCKKARPKKLKSFIPMAKQETSPADLLKTPMRRILLFGKPGIGKTAVAHQMLNLWAQKDHRELDYMFYFDVRDISPSTNPMRLEDLLFNMYSEPEESREEVLQDIKKNSENVVIIFDGITYLSSHSVIKKLVDKDLLPDAKIVITCRPEVPSRDFLTDWPSFRVEVKGFSNESIRAYLIKMLSAEPNPTPNHDSLSSVLNNLELFSLCHVPMYALMVVACIYYSTPEASKQPWPTTKMYINILRYCILKHSGKQTNDLNKCLVENREKILSLAKIAFDATQQKTMNLTELSCELSSVQFSFLGALMIMVEPTVSDTYSAFLHYTMQEFFGALWLLQNPDKIREVLQKCQTEEWKHTKHMVPFMCGLLNERNIQLVNGLVPAQQTKKTSDWFLKEVVNTFLPLQTNQDHAEGDAPEFEIDLLFLCQCLYESQSTEACLLLLDKLDYNLDLDEEHLDPHQCCAVSYMISQSAERKVGLDLNSCTVSDQGLRLILASLKNVRYLGSDPSMLCQLWTTLLSGEADIDFTSLLGLCGNELRLPFLGERRVFERAEEVMKQSLERVNLLLHWDRTTLLSEALSKTILKCLTHINKLSFTPLQHQRGSPEKLEKEEKAVLLDLCLQAGLYHRETFQGAVNTLLSLFSVYQTERYDILLDLYSHVKYNRKQAGRSILPSLRPLYQPAPAVWSIDLSERKASLLLEVLKLQPEKKSVELKYWSDEESEVRSFLQCLPYISQLRIAPPQDQRRSPEDLRKREKTFLLNLCLQAALHERENIQTTVEKVSLSEVYHDLKWDLLLDLYSHVKNYETQTGRSVLPALQTVYQSAPAVWSIDLSERKVSLLLEVLKLQPEKKPVELWGWSDEESEVRSFLQCLPYISELGFIFEEYEPSELIKFLVGLLSQAAEWEEQSGEKTLKLLSSVCTYSTFPLCDWDDDKKWFQCDFLLDLYSHVKDYETQTGRSVLPALQTVYQSAPAVWYIDLSERKASLLLEVLKLQSEKKPVQLEGWSDEDSEVRSFLQCLPYISQLRRRGGKQPLQLLNCSCSFTPPQYQRRSPEDWRKREKTFLLNMCLQAALHERETIQTTVEKVLSLSEVYHDRKWDLLLDLYSHVKDYETQTGRSVLPALQPVYQSAPAVWSIDLSERKASLLLEVLKLQPGKKPVELKYWSDEESEVRSFLQCLPYISQLSFPPPQDQRRSPEEWRKREKTFLLNLCLQAALHERETIQTTVEKVLSLSEVYHDRKWSLLLDLYSHVKDYETQTGRSVLPALQPVYQSAPAVWSIDLSERKASLLLEVLKLQPEKKPVQLEGWSDEESEVRSFLQCLPYISQLSFPPPQDQRRSPEEWRKREKTFLLNLCLQAALHERETIQTTVEKVLSLSEVYHDRKWSLLLDLYSHVKDYETQTGRSVLPALQPVYQSAPAVWSIDLSERKASLLLEVLKLQPEKKPVQLEGWSDEESEVRSFLQCLPYISQLSFPPPQDQRRSPEDWRKREKTFLLNMCLQAALHERENIQTTVEKVSLSEVYHDLKWDLLLDLYSHVKNYETQTGRSVLPALQTVYQSAPAVWSIDLSERKVSLLLEVLKLQPEKKPVELWGWSDEESEVRSFLQCLPYISELGFIFEEYEPSELIKFLVGLLSQAAEWEEQSGEKTLKLLSSVCTYSTFPLCDWDDDKKWFQCDFLLDLYSHVKDYETQTGRSVLPALQTVYQSAPAVWYIDLSERKASLLLEVLKLQSEKKPVQLEGWSDEDSEVRSFLQCLPYISQLRFLRWSSDNSELIKFLVGLLSQAAEWEEQSGEKTLKLVSSVCTYSTFPLCDGDDYDTSFQCDFLLDLYSHVKDYETQTGRSVLPALQPVYQSAPAVWSIDLSERKVSLLLDVLKLQPVKKPVELKGWSDEESEVRSFLQCLPYISQLRRRGGKQPLQLLNCSCSFTPPQYQRRSPEDWRKREKTFLLNMCLQAALHERETIQTTVEKVLSLSEVYHDRKWDLLLDLYSHVKDYETQTGRSVLPALQPVYQSAPAVWSIDLSERKASLLLEVLKLQPGKKPVELKYWSDEESEVRSFLQCLPYISQLSFHLWRYEPSELIKFLVGLLSQAAEWEEQSGEKTLKLLSSVCTYSTFPLCDWDDDKKWFQCDFLLDLYSHVKDYETQTGRSVLPALQPVYQSAPAVWSIDLSERKASLLLEVLKLQPGKKPVELNYWSDEESEVRSFLQCLPYISQLSFHLWRYEPSELIKFLVGLLSQAAEWEEQSGEKTLKLLSSVCTYSTFPLCDWDDDKKWFQSDFLLDLYSHVKDYETQTGRSVLPALQPVYQSAPAVWSIDLSERKVSLLLDVLKLQPEKKPVELKGWSDEDNQVRSFLQCLPYISQLSCDSDRFFQRVCESIPVRSREDAQHLASLLQALGSTLSLGDQLPRKTCRSVVRVLGLCASRVDLTLTPSKISLKGASLLFTRVSQLHKLRLNVGMSVRLARLARRTWRGGTPLTVPELSLVLKSSQPPERVLSRALSSVASLLRFWRVQCLDLTDFCIQGHSLITLLCHQGPLTLRLHSDTLQQLAVVVYEAQDKDLTQWFLEKVGGDLTSCRLDWEVLLSLLQHSTHNITVDLRKNRLPEKNISDLLPFLGRVIFKRLSSSFVKSIIRQIYNSRDSDCVSSLLRSSAQWINLNSRELDRVDCTSLCFTLQHSHQVKVNLLWTSIPPGEIESILPLLDRVSQLSVDRKLLLSFLHSCAASQILQGALSPTTTTTAAELLRALQYRLDFSCSSSVDLSAHDQGGALCLTTDHCRAINSVLKQSQHSTRLVQNPTQNQSRNQPHVQLILKD
ncbi:uncharacterized protein ACWYII_031249 isoform 8-T9 [Salvelinus alpinus]